MYKILYCMYWGLNLGSQTGLGRRSTTLAIPQVLWPFDIFQIGSCVFAWGQPPMQSLYLCLLSRWDYRCGQHIQLILFC
jgi:hypothetical protein